MTNNHLQRIKNLGYTKVSNVFSKDICEKAKKISIKYINQLIMEKDYDNYEGNGIPLSRKDQAKTLNNLHNKDYFYYKFISNKIIHKIMKPLLSDGSYNNSEPYHLINSQVRCLNPLASQQQLHIDSNLPGNNSYVLVIVVIVMLDDFTKLNGPTRIVPKSHKRNYYAENNKKYDDELLILGNAGDVLVLNGATWHGAEENFTKNERWSMNLGYSRWFVKPSFDIPRNINKEIYLKITDYDKELLGLKTVPPIDEFQRMTRKSENYFQNWNEQKKL